MYWLYFYKIVDALFTIFNILIFVRILSSWVPDFYKYKIVQFIAFIVDPYLKVFRRFIPPLGMFDLSPIFALIFLNLLEGFILYFLQ